jgi:hypothetical protein
MHKIRRLRQADSRQYTDLADETIPLRASTLVPVSAVTDLDSRIQYGVTYLKSYLLTDVVDHRAAVFSHESRLFILAHVVLR